MTSYWLITNCGHCVTLTCRPAKLVALLALLAHCSVSNALSLALRTICTAHSLLATSLHCIQAQRPRCRRLLCPYKLPRVFTGFSHLIVKLRANSPPPKP